VAREKSRRGARPCGGAQGAGAPDAQRLPPARPTLFGRRRRDRPHHAARRHGRLRRGQGAGRPRRRLDGHRRSKAPALLARGAAVAVAPSLGDGARPARRRGPARPAKMAAPRGFGVRDRNAV
ncbi:MAG: Endonuclease, partial [uncultured Microvirga sp.]